MKIIIASLCQDHQKFEINGFSSQCARNITLRIISDVVVTKSRTCLEFFISLFFAFTFLTREHKCIVVLLERGVGAHTPHFLLFALASMLILIQIHAYTCTFPFFYFNLRNSLGHPLVKKEATDWDFIFCKSGWSTLAYNILRIGLEPKIKKAISDH